MKNALHSLIFFAIFFAISFQSSAQNVSNYYKKSFLTIDSLATIAKPKDAFELVNKVNAKARIDGNTSMLIKSVMYKILYQGYLEEDVFTKIIKELQQDIASAKQPAKSILQSLLAESYWKYYEFNQYSFLSRTNVQSGLGDDFKTWSTNRFVDETIKNYMASLSDLKLLQATKIDSLSEIIVGNDYNRYLRPKLYDLLAYRALEVLMNTQTIINKSEDVIDFNDPKWFGDYESFLKIKIPEDSSSFSSHALSIFQNLISVHENHQNIGAVTDADLKRLNFVYLRSTSENKLKLYENAILKLADYSKRSEIYSDVLFDLASKKYESRYNRDPKHPLNLVELVDLANSAIKAYPNSIGAKNSEKLLFDIKNQTLQITLNEFIEPNKPAQVFFKYKNVDTIYVKLYKPTEVLDRNYLNNKELYSKFIAQNKVVKQWSIVLPNRKDYQEHSIIDKIDGLEKGNYVIMTQSKLDSSNKAVAYSYANLKVTNLAVTSRNSGLVNHQYFITNSATGEPIENATINERIATFSGSKYLTQDRGSLKTDKNGFAESALNLTVNKIVVSYQGDSVNMDVNQNSYRYQDTKNKVVLFTDRPIYRPGQTVYYKGIYFNYEDNKPNILRDQNVDLTFKDANYKEIEKTSKITNEYGTFQGNFTIPMGKLNGRMSINTTYGGIDVQVEEYKRPTFEITFDKLNQKYKLNDSIRLQGKALTFSGYAVAGAKVKYTISRSSLLTPDRNYGIITYNQIGVGKTETKVGGIFNINFFSATENNNLGGYAYRISVDITDINGETKTKMLTVNAGKSDILLNVLMPSRIFSSSKMDSVSFVITNLNNEPIKAKISTEWFKLEYPGRLINQNFLSKPENYNMSKAEFLKYFPQDEFAGDGLPENWTSNKINFAQHNNVEQGVGELAINSKKISSGYYKVRFKAVNDDQDSIIVEKTVRIYKSEAENILIGREWLIAEKTSIQPGETANFRLASILPNAKAYYEIYYKDKVVDKVWLKVSPKQTLINIKAQPYFVDGFAVQFTMVQSGRIYQSFNEVAIVDENNQLDIKFLTFRDKLQPGEKESWKLSITNKKGEKQMVEMVASLYDASLDDLKAMSWNKISPPKYNYHEYNWNFNLNNMLWGNDLWFLRNYYNYYEVTNRNYEVLNFFGANDSYDFKSNYNQYLRKIDIDRRKNNSEIASKRLEELKASGKIYGVVTDKEGYAIPGAIVKSGNNKTSTDAYGIYTIDLKLSDEITVGFIGYNPASAKVGSAKRINFTLKENFQGLDEVSVVGYGSQNKKDITGSATLYDELKDPSLRQEVESKKVVLREIRIRGSNSRVAYNQTGAPAMLAETVAVSDNNVYDFVSIEKPYDPKLGFAIVNGKPVYGSKNIVSRTNFNETAFFYPQLHTNEAGEINIEFTIPQSLTRYKMMGFAHTKDLKTATITKELITQKQLSISANAPRFFREGDTILFSARLNNLSGREISGNAILALRDALSGKIISIFDREVVAVQKFKLSNNGNQSLKWSLVIPSGIGAITYKLLAQSEKFSDGEEMTIPVLPNSVLVTESMSLSVRGGMSKTFTMDKLLNSGSSKTLKNQSLTFEFTSNPVWYAVQALPYLMEYPYECAEQTFSRFYANNLVTGIINSSSKIKTVFDSWKQTNNGEALLSNLEKNPTLKSILLEETPWVRNADNENERKKRLAILFDLNRMTYELKANFDKLENMQFSNGAFPWFSGMQEDRYITQHITLGIGQLKHLKLANEKEFPKLNLMLSKAINYLDGKLIEDYQSDLKHKTNSTYLQTHYLYARSYTNQKNTNTNFVKAYQFFVNKIIQNWKYMEPYQLAQSALILERNSNHAEAMKIIGLLKQTAQQSDEMGMYWSNNRTGWLWYQNPIETQAVLIEAFDEVAKDANAVEEMKIWLLKNKQTNDWKTTKATASASYALLMRGYDLLSESNEPEILIGGKSFTQLGITEQAKEAGTGYEKITVTGQNIKPEMAQVQVKNNNKTIAWGAYYWQYFEQLDKITSSATGVKINKQLFLQKQSEKGSLLTPLTKDNVLTPGDLLKVRIEIFCDRDMEYIHLKDMRSSGFEPVNVISQYKYQDGLGYYESTKDASTNFFISYLPKGTYVFEYPLRVTHAGNFSNGITTLQSMYAPEFTTHSEGVRINVKPQN
ncbi:MG2 domain-containing protein [Pedobacter fastidiosus]|uniref:Carboxypeptidase-like regulatory domain-containing protein n=1 Tax=Pedobacter fastidiosus TaxID=2765361 RepID=A0ABR7KUB3_9SPHI|nr:MG2 domain-containing protein [Pedobacter fastidiosus]MBC6111704.1 carboxypeptidase-like regulatory domain-containing protein [Pedobacter fastidiosus]